MKSTDSSPSNQHQPSTEHQQCKERIAFILEQIDTLDHHLPETYQMLMDELDQQHLKLKHLEIKDFYHKQNNAEQDKTTHSRHQNQSQKHHHHPTGISNR